MPPRPEVTVAAVVERDGRFLVVEERVHGRLVLNQPAGHVEDRETLFEAVVRETREETAWRLTPRHLLGLYLWRNARTGRSTLRVAFSGEVSEHDPAASLDRGIVGTHWLGRGELDAAHARLRSPLVLRCVDDYLAGRRLPLETVADLDLHRVAHMQAVKVG
ncbi:MAG: Phosphatase NudJ [Steroidobacteraceae bacterium]|nr:Phosphatase NudJ [Steroidobacteraceae bacterium]